MDSDKSSPEGAKSYLKELQNAFNDWCSLLTTHSVQGAYAIIAANWAVHSGKTGILTNHWSRWSMILAIAFLAINLLVIGYMARSHYKRYLYAEEDPERWQKEYEKSSGQRFWPYTPKIEYCGIIMRAIKIFVPCVSAALFIGSLF